MPVSPVMRTTTKNWNSRIFEAGEYKKPVASVWIFKNRRSYSRASPGHVDRFRLKNSKDTKYKSIKETVRYRW
jgi:hypothetical protein